MPRILIDEYGHRTVLTPGGARRWLAAARFTLSPSLDAWLTSFLASGSRAYEADGQRQFRRDLARWVENHTFSLVFAADPLGMLRNHYLITDDDPQVNDTGGLQAYVTLFDKKIFIGSRQFCLFQDTPATEEDKAEPEPLPGIANFTAVRQNTSQNRSAPPVITAAGSWWFTPVQTGCTVVICDWGGGNFSMTHLQPYEDEQYGGVLQYVLERSPRFKAEFKKYALQTNVSAVVRASGQRPDRYILVQSNHTAETETIVVVGHRPGGAGAWTFYYQRYPRYSRTVRPVTAAERLEWQLWDHPWDLAGEYRGAI